MRWMCARFDLVSLKAEPHLQILQVNLTTVFTLCRDVGAHMLKQRANAAGRRGSIINIASLLSFQWVLSSLFSPDRTQIRSPKSMFLDGGVRRNVFDTFTKEKMLIYL